MLKVEFVLYHESDCPWWRSIHNNSRQKQDHNNQVTRVTHSTINHIMEVRVEKLLDHEPANQPTRHCFNMLSRPSLPRQVYSTEDHLIKKDAYAVRFPGKGERGVAVPRHRLHKWLPFPSFFAA
jgi:hypothetical protein